MALRGCQLPGGGGSCMEFFVTPQSCQNIGAEQNINPKEDCGYVPYRSPITLSFLLNICFVRVILKKASSGRKTENPPQRL